MSVLLPRMSLTCSDTPVNHTPTQQSTKCKRAVRRVTDEGCGFAPLSSDCHEMYVRTCNKKADASLPYVHVTTICICVHAARKLLQLGFHCFVVISTRPYILIFDVHPKSVSLEQKGGKITKITSCIPSSVKSGIESKHLRPARKGILTHDMGAKSLRNRFIKDHNSKKSHRTSCRL